MDGSIGRDLAKAFKYFVFVVVVIALAIGLTVGAIVGYVARAKYQEKQKLEQKQ